MEGAECIILANPDVGGIGIRVGVYLQALLPLLISYIDLFLGADEARRESNKDTANALVFTGISLLISAIVQAHTKGLTVYHAYTVLNLCWVTIIGGAPVFVMGVFNNVESMRDLNHKFVFSLFSLKLSLLGAFGIWLNLKVRSFDTSPNNCTGTTVLWWFGRRIPAESWHSRGPLLALYVIMAVPGNNTGTLLLIILGQWLESSAILLNRMSMGYLPVPATNTAVKIFMLPFILLHSPRIIRIFQGINTIIYWAIVAMMITITEKTISINKIAPGEHDWTLGQTFATIVAFFPVFGLLSRFAKSVKLPPSVERMWAAVYDDPLSKPMINGTPLYELLVPEKMTWRQKVRILSLVRDFLSSIQGEDQDSLKKTHIIVKMMITMLENEIMSKYAADGFIRTFDDIIHRK
ncbi:hypothetical protein DL93DRAFT_2095009 [Clavulina sp. PMI_390]|nr:hypothetical protein DL93DRAFT_2095009 [Clavulina sp. PMI_390]